MTRGRATLLLGTVLALCLAVRSLVRTPPPLWVSIAAFVGYAALVILGVLRPSLQMFAEVLWRGPEGARGVALTFDDGPHPESTLAVLDMLDRASAKATFFVIGEKATRWPDVIREIVKRGHLLGVHGNKHDRLLSLRSLSRVRADLASAIEELTKLTGERPRFYRPPVGQTNPRIARAAREHGLTIVGWSVRGRDGVRADPARIASRVVTNVGDRSIVLLHDAAERDDRVPDGPRALPLILEGLRERDLECVRLDGWSP